MRDALNQLDHQLRPQVANEQVGVVERVHEHLPVAVDAAGEGKLEARQPDEIQRDRCVRIRVIVHLRRPDEHVREQLDARQHAGQGVQRRPGTRVLQIEQQQVIVLDGGALGLWRVDDARLAVHSLAEVLLGAGLGLHHG